MKLRLLYPGRVPYDAPYVINKPELGIQGFGTTFEMLETNVRTYRRANGIPTGLGFSEELEQVVCEKYPAECEQTDDILPLKRRLSLGDVIRGTKVLASFKLAGSPLVPQEEAIRRATICSKCPLCKPFPRTCTGMCGEIKEAVEAVIGHSYTTPMDNDERACSLCHCFAAAHVRLPYRFLKLGLTEEMKLQFQKASEEPSIRCWKTENAI